MRRRPLCTILASFVLTTNLLEAQDSKSKSSESAMVSTSGGNAVILSLLQQSHDLDHQLPMSECLEVLPKQAQMVSQLRADLGREWANELFTLSFQTKGAQRSSVQNAAMGILIRLAVC
jgi:hypothetical protein